MSAPPSLGELLRQRHEYILRNLQDASSFISHPTEKGDATEQVWLEALQTYLPSRYDVRRGFVIDSQSNYSKQIDAIIHDRFYTPFLLKVGGYHVVPVESVYAVFEVKQKLDANNISQAEEKVESVRRLSRMYRSTNQVADPAEKHVIGGLLTTRSTYSDPLSRSVVERMRTASQDRTLDYVCVGENGLAVRKGAEILLHMTGSWITNFILGLIGGLQELGTVPPIDVAAYQNATSLMRE